MLAINDLYQVQELSASRMGKVAGGEFRNPVQNAIQQGSGSGSGSGSDSGSIVGAEIGAFLIGVGVGALSVVLVLPP